MHSTSIQNTTKSVHEETVRVVDQQIKDLDVQMKDLDDFVTRAKTQNAEHHEQHAESMRNLDDAVEKSFTTISERFVDTFERAHQMSQEMDTDINQLCDTLPPLDDELIQPLASLRHDIQNTLLHEYEPTGETPAKVQYQYPTDLPRTQPHDILIAGMCDAPTPSKPAPVQIPVIFGDESAMDTAEVPSVPPAGSDPLSPPLPNERPSSSGNSTGNQQAQPQQQAFMETPASRQRTLSVSTVRSLREVNPNLSLSATAASKSELASLLDTTVSMPAIGEDENTINLTQTAPLLKRSVTGSSAGTVTGKATRGSTRKGGLPRTTRGPTAVIDENALSSHNLLAASERGSKRKSPRLH